jgi:serine/threonine protein kinase
MSSAQHRLALPAGYELGRYQFKEVLGSGGFGITYLAYDRTLNRRVAVKELLPNDIATRVDGTTVVAKTESEDKSLGWARERFMDEGRALAACDHPNVVNVYEMVEANGTAYMVTKYEEGRSMEQWLRELGRPPNESELRSVLMPLLSGLETVHQAGFLHRDIKPDNIYITKNGRPVLLDFGSARQAISNRSMAMTSIITSGYAPFEQYHDDGKQGPWSDIYALAAVMFRALTGKKPPEATRRLKEDPCPKLAATLAGQYDAGFLDAIDRGLAVNEAERPQTVAAWRSMFTTQGSSAPADDEATRILPRTTPPPLPFPLATSASGSAPPATVASPLNELLKSPLLFKVGLPAAVVLLLALTWFVTRGHGNGSPSIGGNGNHQIGLIDLVPGNSPNEQPAKNGGNRGGSPDDNQPPGNAAVTPNPNPGAPAVGQIDPRLVGTWEVVNAPSGKKLRWEQSADGHYVMSGAINDAGVISAGDGQIRQYSNASQQAIESNYQFNGAHLITAGQGNTTEWQRITDNNSRRQTSSRGNDQPGHKVKVRTDDISHSIRRVFRHFP